MIVTLPRLIRGPGGRPAIRTGPGGTTTFTGVASANTSTLTHTAVTGSVTYWIEMSAAGSSYNPTITGDYTVVLDLH